MSQPEQRGIDPRGPRFGAGITAVLLLVTVFLALLPSAGSQLAALILLIVIALLFAWGAFAGIQRHPYGLLFKKLVRPRLAPPAELENPAPPTFAQFVGLLFAGVGVILGAVGIEWGVWLFAAFAFVAAFLNSVFAYCLGCQVYLLLAHAGLLGQSRRGETLHA